MRAGAALLAAAFALSACAGPDAKPVAVVQPGDKDLDCVAIQAEILANNKTVQELSGAKGAKVAQNVAAGVAGLFIWPLWFAMDFKGAAGTEEEALQNRQQYLGALAIERHCPGASSAAEAAAQQISAPGHAAVPAPAAHPMAVSAPGAPAVSQ